MDWGIILGLLGTALGAAAAILGGLVGGVIGGWAQGRFWYSYEKRRAKEENEKQRAAVRTTIRLELDEYLTLMARGEKEVWNRKETWVDLVSMSMQHVNAVKQILPHLDSMLWVAQMPILPHVLDQDEIVALLRLMRASKRVYIQSEILGLTVQGHNELARSLPIGIQDTGYPALIQDVWTRLHDAVATVAALENPVRES